MNEVIRDREFYVAMKEYIKANEIFCEENINFREIERLFNNKHSITKIIRYARLIFSELNKAEKHLSSGSEL